MNNIIVKVGYILLFCCVSFLSVRFAPVTVVVPQRSVTTKPEEPMLKSGTESVVFSVSPKEVAPGEIVTARWSGYIESATDDWIGMFNTDQYDNKYLGFKRTGGGNEGTLELKVPVDVESREYELRFYSQNSWVLIKRSDPFVVRSMKKWFLTRICARSEAREGLPNSGIKR